MLVTVEGSISKHKQLYDVELQPAAKPLFSPDDLVGDIAGGWRAVLVLQLFSTLAHGAAQLPVGAP